MVVTRGRERLAGLGTRREKDPKAYWRYAEGVRARVTTPGRMIPPSAQIKTAQEFSGSYSMKVPGLR